MKNIGVLAFARMLKLLANITKLAAYGFHYVFPSKRFTIPERAEPLWRSKRGSRIPRRLWQTNFTNRVTLPVYLNYLCNRLLAPSHEYRFLITDARAAFIEEHYSPEILATYLRLQVGAAQADYWRVLVLQKMGGVYLDIDAHLVWPLSLIVTPECDELFITTRKGEISNYFIASAAENPHLKRVADAIYENIENDADKNIFELTGPGVFNKVLSRDDVRTRLFRYTCNQGNFTNEYFQYLDKPQGKWTKEQYTVDVVRKRDALGNDI